LKDQKYVAEIVSTLETALGVPERVLNLDPLSCLVLTILSQNTNDKNRDTAYSRLRQHFPRWEDVMNADVAAIADAIRPGGLANQKSQRIQKILQWIHHEYGALGLDFLCELDPQETIDKFTQLKGIGVKTISVVMMFSCGIDIFPVDTHVHRICRRLGLVPEKASAEKTFWLMQPLVPDGKSYSLHKNFLKLGRSICLARRPNCPLCPIAEFCNFYLSIQKAAG